MILDREADQERGKERRGGGKGDERGRVAKWSGIRGLYLVTSAPTTIVNNMRAVQDRFDKKSVKTVKVGAKAAAG